MIMGRAVPLRWRGLGDCLSVSIPGVGTSSDCGSGPTSGSYVDAAGNLIVYDASGNVTTVPSSSIPAAPGQPTGTTGNPKGDPGSGVGLCHKILGTGTLQNVVCSPWFLVAAVVVGGVAVFKILK